MLPVTQPSLEPTTTSSGTKLKHRGWQKSHTCPRCRGPSGGVDHGRAVPQPARRLHRVCWQLMPPYLSRARNILDTTIYRAVQAWQLGQDVLLSLSLRQRLTCWYEYFRRLIQYCSISCLIYFSGLVLALCYTCAADGWPGLVLYLMNPASGSSEVSLLDQREFEIYADVCGQGWEEKTSLRRRKRTLLARAGDWP